MVDLSKFVSKHYNVSDSDLPKIVVELQALIDSDNYDDPRDGICEYELYDLVDNVICNLGITE